jgi:hypothetical protein
MKLFNSFFRYFYSIEVKNSENQLRLDFGDFPPVPLHCVSLKNEFKVIRARSIGIAYFEWRASIRLVKSLEIDPSLISKEFIYQYGVDYFNDLLQFFDKLNKFPEFFKRIFIIPITLNMTFRKIMSIANKPDGIGVFTPLLINESNLLIRSVKFISRSDESVISHEHIHLLQHRNPEPHSRHVKSPETLLLEKYSVTPYCLYQLEKNEVEARLHELVLSFYRSHGYIPTTVKSFLGLIAVSSQFDWPVYDYFELYKIDYETSIVKFPARDSNFVEELLTLLQWIKTDELRLRFSTEVLTVMYGNLLRYYGDHVASLALISEIPRPNYYDELYGEQIKSPSSFINLTTKLTP